MSTAGAVTQPLVMIGLGPMGIRVVRDLDDTATSLAAPEPSPHRACLFAGGNPLKLRDQLHKALQELLQAGRVHGGDQGRAQLDVAVFADLSENDSGALIDVCSTVTELLADEYAVLFPATSAPEKRSAWLALYLATPALVNSAEGRRMAKTITALEDWSGAARHPALARAFLLPRQTTAGRLGEDSMETSLRLCGQALYLSGLRDADQVRSLLTHRTDTRFFASIGIAAAELPLARVRRYARWRAALDGLRTLVDLAEHPANDPARAEALLSRLAPDELLAPFEDGEPAKRARARAATLSGAGDNLPERFRFPLTDGIADVRSRFRVLFEPVAKPWQRRTDPTADPDHQGLMRQLDQAESQGLAEADRRIHGLLDDELSPQTAMAVLPHLEQALGRALHGLEERLAEPEPVLPSPEPPPPPDDPGLESLTETLNGRPGLRRTWPVVLVLLYGVGVAAALGATIWAIEPGVPGAAGPAFSSGTAPTAGAMPSWAPWAGGGLLGLLSALVWSTWVLRSWRRTMQKALEARATELAAAWKLGGAGQEREQAERLLAVRTRRLARDLAARLRQSADRLRTLRAALRQTQDRAALELASLRVRLGDAPRNDDLSGLLESSSPLHHPLVDSADLAGRLASARKIRDANRWATDLLQSTWPANGLLQDLPVLDEDRLLRACDSQLGAIGAEALLSSEDRGLHERIRVFLSSGVGAIGWGVDPRDTHGDPVLGTGRDRRVLLAPLRLRVAVEGALGDQAVLVTPTWSQAPSPWLSVLAVWEGFVAEELIRGMGQGGSP